VTRRGFLRSSALVGGACCTEGFGVAGVRPDGPGERQGAGGVIGCGGMGRGDLDTFFLNPEVECPVVCDVDDANDRGGR
jgi:hypothetical protein